jgi:hypothetical protein
MRVRVALLAVLLAALPSAARAQQDCRFLMQDGVMHLLGDCQTDQSIELRQDDVTLDGHGHVIIAVDTPAHPFEGGVVVARGRHAAVVNTRVSTFLTTNSCLEGDALLRGIYFDGASGEISGNTVRAISRGSAACEEGNGIEVRNRDRDGAPTSVLIRDNHVDQYQKTAIVVHGNVEATIERNEVGSSVAHPVIAPNGIQVGPQASAGITNNHIAGNFTGRGAAGPAGSAILLTRSGAGTVVDHNLIEGDEDVGIYVAADGASITDNVVRDVGGAERIDEVGVVNDGTANLILGNTVTGFRTSYYGVEAPSPASRGLQIE